ncbi:MAG: hypothetical protein K0S27_1336 [Gammaproteobacteria bacterium]|jgi:hypothetical protein|nr:hypothetical protein [Gammaproteobacteria bacterium]
MNPLNRIAGVIIGAVTGALTVALQIPYAYYVFARNRREAGYSWPLTLLATATLGNLAVLGASLLILSAAVGMIGWGMKVGFGQGVMGAITLPYAFHTELQRNLASSKKGDLFIQMGDLVTAGIYSIVDTDSQGKFNTSKLAFQDAELASQNAALASQNAALMAEHARLVEEQLREENARVLQAMTQEILDALQQQQGGQPQVQNNQLREQRERWVAEAKADFLAGLRDIDPSQEIPNENDMLLEKIKMLPVNKEKEVPLLTEAEIKEYEEAIKKLPPKEQAEKEKELMDYKDAIKCSITLEVPSVPITVVLPGQNGVSRTYDCEDIKKWINTENLAGKDASDPHSRYLLKDLVIHRGYSSKIINFVKEVREANKQLALAKKNPESTASDLNFFRKRSASIPSSDPTLTSQANQRRRSI